MREMFFPLKWAIHLAMDINFLNSAAWPRYTGTVNSYIWGKKKKEKKTSRTELVPKYSFIIIYTTQNRNFHLYNTCIHSAAPAGSAHLILARINSQLKVVRSDPS